MLKKFFLAIGISAFTIIAAANLSFAPEAQAFGWSSIKKAGKAVGSGAKKAGKAVGRNSKKAAKAVGRGTEKAGKAVGSGAKKAGKWVGSNSKKAGKAVWEGGKCIAKGGCATIGDPPTTTMTRDHRT